MTYFPKRFAALLGGDPAKSAATRAELEGRLAQVDADIAEMEDQRDTLAVEAHGEAFGEKFPQLEAVVARLGTKRDLKDALQAGLRRLDEAEQHQRDKAAKAERRRQAEAVMAHAQNATNAASALTAALESAVRAWEALCTSRAAMLAAIPSGHPVLADQGNMLHPPALERAVLLELARLGAVVPHVTGQPRSEVPSFPGAKAPLSHLHRPGDLPKLGETLAHADQALRATLLEPVAAEEFVA